ncbi:TetR family transcriptional regulator [Hyphomicrobiales bacterium 4NK60-0047b]
MRPSKRDELVQEALKVFYQNGFTATGMDMLVKKTGISKTSMYKHFRTKDDLILAVLRLRDEQLRNWFFRRVEELASSPLGQLLAVFDVLEEWFQQPDFQGCMFIKASSEFQCVDDPIYNQCTEHKKLMFNSVLKIVRELETDSGKLSPEIAEKLTRQLFLLKEGAIVLKHMGVNGSAGLEAKEAAVSLLQANGIRGV